MKLENRNGKVYSDKADQFKKFVDDAPIFYLKGEGRKYLVCTIQEDALEELPHPDEEFGHFIGIVDYDDVIWEVIDLDEYEESTLEDYATECNATTDEDIVVSIFLDDLRPTDKVAYVYKPLTLPGTFVSVEDAHMKNLALLKKSLRGFTLMWDNESGDRDLERVKNNTGCVGVKMTGCTLEWKRSNGGWVSTKIVRSVTSQWDFADAVDTILTKILVINDRKVPSR